MSTAACQSAVAALGWHEHGVLADVRRLVTLARSGEIDDIDLGRARDMS